MVIGYKATIDWLVRNDDCEWLFDPNGSPSVSTCLVADQFCHPIEKVTKDLKKRYIEVWEKVS